MVAVVEVKVYFEFLVAGSAVLVAILECRAAQRSMDRRSAVVVAD